MKLGTIKQTRFFWNFSDNNKAKWSHDGKIGKWLYKFGGLVDSNWTDGISRMNYDLWKRYFDVAILF